MRWMADTLAAGKTPYLYTFASSAVALCRTAAQLGIDLAGAQFAVTGEPLTPARLAAIRAAGAQAANHYGSAEAGPTSARTVWPRPPPTTRTCTRISTR